MRKLNMSEKDGKKVNAKRIKLQKVAAVQRYTVAKEECREFGASPMINSPELSGAWPLWLKVHSGVHLRELNRHKPLDRG